MLTITYLMSGDYSLILCNVLCTLPPVQKSIIIYWIVCGISFACDTIYTSMSGYSYIKLMTLMFLFHYCMVGNIDSKHIAIDDVLSGQFKRHAKEWTANRQSRHKYTSKDVTSNTLTSGETMLNSLKTVPNESVSIKPLWKLLARLCSSRIGGNEREIEDGRAENHQLTDCTANPASRIEGLVSFPDSQVMIRKGHIGPAILAFTNNYKKPVIWALKTNAIRRLVAFPTVGIIPPSETVQIKVDLVEQIPRKILKDRLSLEYFVIDQKVFSENNYNNFFHHNKSIRMKKSLEVVYVQ
uniref:Major sperm protein n=1 Tax=Onchocerca volvulus TaxID=6282 RepID=A0A8R1TJS7_ONCVO